MQSKPTLAAIIGVFFILAAGASRSAGATPPRDACSLLTQTQVSAGLGVTAGVTQTVDVPALCIWAEPDGPNATHKRVVLTFITPDAFDSGKAPVSGITKTPVSGMGDDAYYGMMPGIATTLRVKKGTIAFSIEVKGNSFSVDQIKAIEKTLAQDALAKL